MVGYTPGQTQLSHQSHILAGAASGVVTRIVTQPLDVLKIRFQLQIEPISRNATHSKYKGIIHSFRTILKEETWAAFWKGHVSSQGLAAVFMAAEFASFEAFTKLTYTPDGIRTMEHFISGAGAGTVATIVSYPFDIIRTRFIAQGNRKVYHSIVGAVHHIHKSDGVYGFYRGSWAAVCHNAPQSGIYFGLYTTFKQLTSYMIGHHHIDTVSAVSGAAAGISSKLLVYPFDTSKRRLQVIGFEHGRKDFGATRTYRSMIRQCMVTFKEEGIRGLYKGASWAFIKSGIGTSLYFYLYEKICSTLRQRQDEY